MRDTARLQCLALVLLGAFAWMSLDVASLRSALAGVLGPDAVEAPAEPAGLEDAQPVLSQDVRPARSFEIRVIRTNRPLWTLETLPEKGVS